MGPTSRSTSPDALSARLQPSSLLSTPKMKKLQSAQPTGRASTGTVSRLSCTPVPASLAADKTSNPLALASRPSDLLHSSNATAEALATTLAPPTPSGCPPSKKNLPLQPLRCSRAVTSDNASPDARSANVPQLAPLTPPPTPPPSLLTEATSLHSSLTTRPRSTATTSTTPTTSKSKVHQLLITIISSLSVQKF